ncbi:sushi domain-containing protein 1 [Thalassophryne amazonica]|uniref:sushi domain-containing protein 1 n=1 Tax=Thalassophryne amazonica TaxID=390379 RepID=UPI00147219FC|nr:sushi domain-containing protein 1 [Thalassophryne amazonica]
MDKRNKTVMVMMFILCAISDTEAEYLTRDVCTTCHANATCEDKFDGSGKVCNCKYGFVGNGITFCQDKDECQIGTSKICGPHTTCHNTYGSYYCRCLSGYSPSNNMSIFIPNDGTHCQDINECRISGLCGSGALCRNLDGTFECSCQPGYRVQNGADPFQPHTDTASCKVTDCGRPPSVEDTVLLSVTGTTYGSTAVFGCDEGFKWTGGDNTSVCGDNGLWTRPTVLCEEIKCGTPPLIESTEQVWNSSATPGSTVLYTCTEGFYSGGGLNVSLCNEDGQWTFPTISCKEVSCGAPLTPRHTNLLWDGTSRPGAVVLYECVDGFYLHSGDSVSTCLISGEWAKVSVQCKAKCGPVPLLTNAEVVWENSSIVIHRCVDGYHSWRGNNASVCSNSGMWQKATLRCIEIKPAVNHVFVLNENCVQWNAEKYEDDTEVYQVTYFGSRDFQRSFHHKRKQFLSSKSDQLQLCLKLHPLTNYSISITAVSARFTATVTTNTSLTAPPAPVVYYTEFESPASTLRLHRSANTLDPISIYQVLVLPVEQILVFDCSSSPQTVSKSPINYLRAQILVRHIGTEMNFTVGDGLYYGGVFNAPLQNGMNYYIVLRTVSQWKTDIKSSCVLWAKIKGTNYILKVSALSAAASIGLVASVIFGGYAYSWFLKKT